MQEAYYLRVFPLVYQWTSSHHFTVRLYSQQAVFSMWAELSSLPSLRKHFEMMENLISFMKLSRYIVGALPVLSTQVWSISLATIKTCQEFLSETNQLFSGFCSWEGGDYLRSVQIVLGVVMYIIYAY